MPRCRFTDPAPPAILAAPSAAAGRARCAGRRCRRVSACAAPVVDQAGPAVRDWDRPREARGQTVSLWMWGGDPQGNAYVDDVLAPAAAEPGVTLRRVPVADTSDALNRVLAERQAGRDRRRRSTWCGSTATTSPPASRPAPGGAAGPAPLPNMRYTDPADPLLTDDFGTAVDGCEAPWHKAQFTLVYDSAEVDRPAERPWPECSSGPQAHPGRFTYPAPPDFTGSVFVRQVLYAVSGGHAERAGRLRPGGLRRADPRALAAAARPGAVAVARRAAPTRGTRWRWTSSSPTDQVDMTMTYGPATLTELVADGTFPATTRVLTLDEGTVGNASFLAIPATSGGPGRRDGGRQPRALPRAAAAKADPDVWGQFTVLDESTAAAPRTAAPVRGSCHARRWSRRTRCSRATPARAVGRLGAAPRRGLAPRRAGAGCSDLARRPAVLREGALGGALRRVLAVLRRVVLGRPGRHAAAELWD